MIGKVYTAIYTDVKIANNTNINHIMVSFTNHYNDISIDRSPQKLKSKVRGLLIYKDFSFSIKKHTQKKDVQLQWIPGI